MFSDRFLAALGGWQNGWREDYARRLKITEELQAAIAAEGLSGQFLKCADVCYRKRFLVPSNPQNGGDLGSLFIKGYVEEGVAAWTTDAKFAQEFKDPLRDGAFSVVFAHRPAEGEVVLNVPALWSNPTFKQRVVEFKGSGGLHADALLNFSFRQSEIIMDASLRYNEVHAICGRSSPFEVLCELQGLFTDEDRDLYWKELVVADTFPEDPRWIEGSRAQSVLERTKEKFMNLHGSTLAKVLDRR